jgi:hypothetical protein
MIVMDKRVHIFSEYIDERDGFLQVCDSVWINYAEEDVSDNI